MRNILAAGIFAAILSSSMLAQNGSPAPDPAAPQAQPPSTQTPPQTGPQTATESTPQAATGNQVQIAPGSIIPVQLTKTIDAKKAKTGDEVVAKVTMDMKGNNGEVIVPKDTKVTGHITEAQARSKDQKESQLAIAFDQAMLKEKQVPLPMSIQAVIGQQSNSNAAEPSAPAPGGTPSPSGTGAGATSPMGGRTPSAGANPQPSGSDNAGGEAQAGTNPRPQITAKTQGVIGISNLNLSPNSNAKQGSTLTSDKNNVKLESGTMLLLRVNQ